MKGNMKHIGFFLDRDKDFDRKCIDILENLPKGENRCSYIRKAIVFYNKYNGKAVDKRDTLSQEEKLDLILAKLDGLSLPLQTVPESTEPSEPKVKKAAKPKKLAVEKEPEEVKEEFEEEVEEPVIPEPIPEPVPVEKPKKAEEPVIEEEDDGLHLSVSADTELNDDNFDDIMGGFLDDDI